MTVTPFPTAKREFGKRRAVRTYGVEDANSSCSSDFAHTLEIPDFSQCTHCWNPTEPEPAAPGRIHWWAPLALLYLSLYVAVILLAWWIGVSQ